MLSNVYARRASRRTAQSNAIENWLQSISVHAVLPIIAIIEAIIVYA